MIQSLVLSLILFAPTQTHAQELGNVESFSNLSSYLETKTNGGVKPTQASSISFKIDKLNKVATPILPASDPTLIHSLFETDVERLIHNSNSTDFTEAKKKFYKAQVFDNRTQQYTKPYVYPSDWHSLYHNPVQKFDLPNSTYGKQFEPLAPSEIRKSPLLNPALHHRLDALTDTEMTAGNKTHLLSNGENSFKEKLRMVKESKKFFHSVVMVQYCDDRGSEIVDAMIERAQAGVDVRLFVESVWTNLVLKKCLVKLQNGGVKVTLGNGFFNPRTLFTVHHTKFWIRDGEEGIIGGQNMHDFENTSTGFNDHTRDKDIYVTGPAVTDMMKEYIRIWNHQRSSDDPSMEPYKAIVAEKQEAERQEHLRGPALYESWLNHEVSDIPGVCRVLVQGTATSSEPSIIAKAYIEILKNVKFNMFVGTPTFRYTENSKNAFDNSQIIRAILEGADRGVKVDLISNGVDGGWGEASFQLRKFAQDLRSKGRVGIAILMEKFDRIMAIFNSKSQHKYLSKVVNGPNTDVWLYFNHIHSKQMMFDDIMTSTGSFNLDSHSYRNNESTMICLDKKLADESMTGFMSDIVNSVPAF